ncbi:hypothetical protein AVEN_170917-1 [Araneus ventricosus]|uniref:Uncharacterized protein n=1 Tax=Araneus ventricosus TaxID=182803 RepID=A0A4Y2JF52_ARAVE|nr:hypothetical protein AVEN_170917-1 [Araneus ventricosus]
MALLNGKTIKHVFQITNICKSNQRGQQLRKKIPEAVNKHFSWNVLTSKKDVAPVRWRFVDCDNEPLASSTPKRKKIHTAAHKKKAAVPCHLRMPS